MILERIRQIIADQTGIEVDRISPDSGLKMDLGIDSLDIYKIIMILEEEFMLEISTEDLEDIKKVADLAEYLQDRTSGKPQ